MSKPSKAGIETSADGGSYIPSSKRADGSTRKEIKVRPGYRPPEDIETYKNRSAEAWKNRSQGGVPGADPVGSPNEQGAPKSKNAKRREAARRKGEANEEAEDVLATAMQKTNLTESQTDRIKQDWRDPSKLQVNDSIQDSDPQKKIRNQLKKLKAVRELKDKRASGEKLSLDQIMKIGKESELVRDLKKLGYDGPEMQADATEST
ncbi:hypothetical protein PV08_07230 [Exophiala spinifera]|uniref:WIBG Mago-binding domain-containing protein n=1 Tax=Exophiala spinifera TaxID=91928 RepID=A0A0D1YHQ2_9EURO|nr:uncharacterized protein PV08_07230 [Exophiala spinifera]KIW14446.1 hypothetical protein PV08_07230 [Exophiala spinifera]